ncbi:MAG TPA: hypothetical protein VHA11_08520 [Bryobacteraceae bacterium]|nr:hypothetical protein [Bryobacteraceae bacterium]
MRKLLLFPLLLVSLLFPFASTAASIVVNPGFENGKTNWSVTGLNTVSHSAFYDGTHSLWAGLSATASQTVTTVPGQSYDLSFWLANYSPLTPTSLQVFWGSELVLTLLNEPLYNYTLPSQWHNYTVPSLEATAGSMDLRFAFNSPQGLFLDAVSLEVRDSPVPEPASAILIGAALVPLFWLHRSRLSGIRSR